MAETIKVDKSTPFWDCSLSVDKRIDWLLTQMTIEEKLDSMPSSSLDLPRLGIPRLGVGGEAAHGVEGRNDQNGLGEPDISTSFPQPIGMSATWDTELIKRAGEVTGTEARVISHRHAGAGLSRWAPTVDLERDPRWGRNEEGYGEDPYLTGKMAGAYIQGMQGDDPFYIRCAATLKHFYANNMERYRCFVNTTVDPRNKYEYYLDVFRRCIMEGKPEGVMAAYNGINGIPGMLNPELKEVLKEKYGLTHVVSDGSATVLVVKQHHYFGIHAETVAAALKAGTDAFSDKPSNVNAAVREAYELGLIDEGDLDTALRNMLRTKIKLGVYDRVPSNPYDLVTEEDICSAEAGQVSLQMAREAVVLLKNEAVSTGKNMLPLEKEALDDTALIGPVADEWYMDWYGGRPPYQVTTKDGLEKIKGSKMDFADGKNRVIFYLADEQGNKTSQGITVTEDEKLSVTDTPDVFIVEDWGEESFTFKCERTGKFMNCEHPEKKDIPGVGDRLYCSKQETFEWFVHELFHVIRKENNTLQLTTRFDYPLQVNERNEVVTMHEELQNAFFVMEIVQDGIQNAKALAKTKQQVVLVLGCNPMINAKEEIDRTTLALPPAQKALFDAVYAVNQNVVLALQCNYPYALGEVKDKAKAILWTATGGQDMGTAVAETLVGENKPAGRLNQTWYLDDGDLPDMNDYDIIQHPRTYRYFEKEVLFPFGFGLTYSRFVYEDLQVEASCRGTVQVCFTIRNAGTVASDEVVQVYATAPKCRVKRPIKQLVAFRRVKDIQPGEKRTVALEIASDDLRYFDVISKTMLLEEGEYTIHVGPDSSESALTDTVFVKGTHPGYRDLRKKQAVEYFDEQSHVELTVGHFGFTAAKVAEEEVYSASDYGRPVKEKQNAEVLSVDKEVADKVAVLVYRDCCIDENMTNLRVHMYSDGETDLQVLLDGEKVGSFLGDTIHYQIAEPFLMGWRAVRDYKYQEAHRGPQYTDVVIPLTGVKNSKSATLELQLKGAGKICYFVME